MSARLSAITGQKQTIQLIVSQQNSCADRSASTLAVWKLGLDHPGEIVCSGSKYQYPYAPDGVHFTAEGYRELGEKYGQIFFERVILGNGWQPLQPVRVERQGAVITIHYLVPVPPLVWETTFQPPRPSLEEWKEGKGFEVTAADGNRVTISSATISGDAVIEDVHFVATHNKFALWIQLTPAYFTGRGYSSGARPKVSKVYLETTRNAQLATESDVMTLKKFFTERGIKTSAGLGLTANEPNGFQSYCYSTPADCDKVKAMTEFTARHFDEIILDDFFSPTGRAWHVWRRKWRSFV